METITETGEENLQKNGQRGVEQNENLLYDLSMLNEIGRGNVQFIEKMVRMFCDQTPLLVNEMKGAYYEKNLEKMGSIAHKIKPSIDNLNIDKLKQVIRNIEGAGHGVETFDLQDLIEETDVTISKVIEGMKKEFSIQ